MNKELCNNLLIAACQLSAIASVCVIGCQPPATDSWQDFTQGAIFDSPSPSMSPSGEWIAFASPRTGRGDIYRIKPDGTKRTRLTVSPCFECAPLYCPDGHHILFAREEDGARHIWIMRDDGSQQRRITADAASDAPEEISSDGQWLIAFRSRDTGGLGKSGEALALRIDGKGDSEISLRYGGTFSPDGRQIAFCPAEEEIWLLDLETMSRRKLTNGTLPRFFPDGRRLAFLSAPSDSLWSGMWRSISLDDKQVAMLGEGAYCLITQDGMNAVYFSSDYHFEILRAAVGSRSVECVGSPIGYKTWLRPCKGGFLFTHIGEDRAGEICFLSSQNWSVTSVAPIR